MNINEAGSSRRRRVLALGSWPPPFRCSSPAARRSSYPPAPRSLPAEDYNYIIGPLDVINIIVWRNPELSLTVPVRPDGKVTTPLVERPDWRWARRRRSSRGTSKRRSAKYIRDPVVTVIVTTFVGPASEQIRVIGEATKPQILAFRRNMTLLDVMIAVGGLTDFADGNRASIFRAERRRQAVQRATA